MKPMKSELACLFPPEKTLASMGQAQRRLVIALRQCVMHGKARSCPMRSISLLLGGTGRGKAFLRIVREMGESWPEPVRVLRPCSGKLTYDEALLIEMIDRAVHRDIAGFDKLLQDMLDRDRRSRLFGEILAFAAAFIGPAPRHAV